jgi:hypothetical protein
MIIRRNDIGIPVDGTGSPPFINKWVAAHNPVILEFQRLDFQFISTTSQDSGNQTRLNLPVSNPNFIYRVGDVIPVFNASFEFVNFHTITDINLTTGSPTIDATFGLFTSGSFNSHRRRNYYIEIRANGILPSTGEEVIRSIKVTTDRKGVVRADISGILRSYMALDLTLDYDTNPAGSINVKDVKGYISTEYQYREMFQGSAGNFIAIDSPVKSVNGAFQIQHEFNGYYNNYVVTPLGNKAKPLTRFARPMYWTGRPWTIDYLFDQEMLTTECSLFRGIFKGELATLDNTFGVLIADDDEQLNETRFDALNRIYYDFAQNITDAADFFRLVIQTNEPKMELTELTIVDILRPNCEGYYLRWRNTLGGTDYFLFDNYKNENFTVEGKGIYSRFFDSIEQQDSTGEWNTKSAADQIQMRGKVKAINLDGFKDLLSSPRVQIWIDGKWQSIIVIPASFKVYDSDDVAEVEITATLSEKQIQTA